VPTPEVRIYIGVDPYSYAAHGLISCRTDTYSVDDIGLLAIRHCRSPKVPTISPTAIAYLLFVAGKDASLWLGIIVPMAFLGIAFSIIVAPLTAQR